MEATTFFTLSLLFFSFAPKLGESVRPSRGILPPAVVDTSGNQLRKGEYYHLLVWPDVFVPGTIVFPISPLVENNGTCWVQRKVQPNLNITAPSVPVTFSPIPPNEDDIIRESTPLYIDFPKEKVSDACGDSLWRVINDPDLVFGQRFVVVGTDSGITSDGYFKIESNSKHPWPDYKLLFCPLLGSDSLQHSFDDDCHIIGIFLEEGRSGRLARDVTPDPFAFVRDLKSQSDQHIKMSVS